MPEKMIVEIKSRWGEKVLYSGRETLYALMEKAVAENANLGGANLRDANLTPIRDDVYAVLSSAPAEAAGLFCLRSTKGALTAPVTRGNAPA